MKQLLLCAALACVLSNVNAQELVVERPAFSVSKSKYHEVEKITLTDTAALFNMVGINNPHWWITMSDQVHLRIGEKTYPVKHAENIAFGAETYTDDKGEHRYTLVFDPIPLDTKQVDFITSQSDASGVYGIELRSPRLTNRIALPKEAQKALKIKDDKKPLEAPDFKHGKAKFNGRFMAYPHGIGYEIMVAVNDPVIGGQESFEIKVLENGEFSSEIPLSCAQSVLFQIFYNGNYIFYNDYILLSPDEETTVYIDLQQKSQQEARIRADKCNEAQFMVFTGANAEINNQMNRPEVLKLWKSHTDYGQLYKDIAGMTALEYKEYRMKKAQEAIAEIPRLKLTRKGADFLALKITYNNLYYLMFGDSDLRQAYRQVHNINKEEDMQGFIQPVMDAEYYSFLKDSPINDPVSILESVFGNVVNSCKYLDKTPLISIGMSSDLLDQIVATENLDEEDLATIELIKSELPENWSKERIEQTKEGYKSLLQEIVTLKKLSAEQMEKINNILALCDNDTRSINDIQLEFLSTLIEDFIMCDTLSVEELNSMHNTTEIPKPDSTQTARTEQFEKKYAKTISSLEKRKKIKQKQQYLADILGIDKGIAFDLMETQEYGQSFKQKTPLEKLQLQFIAELENPFYLKYLSKKNEEMIAQIEENKQKTGYNVHETPEAEEEACFEEIIKPFKGKSIMIDFWETWCGPCRSAMKQFESTKEKFKDKNVAFVYLASESSPKNAWENMIPDIAGEHYRLTAKQSKYLKNKFGVSGVPSYLILDKEGNQIYFRVGFEGASAIEKKLNEAL